MLRKICLVLALASIMACRQNEKNTEASRTTENAQPEQLTFRTETVSQQSDGCAQAPDACGTAAINYVAAAGGPETLRNRLNSYVQRRLLALQLDNNPDADTAARANAAEVVAASFIKQYESYANEMAGTEAPRVWELKTEVKPIYHTSKIISLRTDTYTYTGGAHPLSTTSLQSFDSAGQEISLPEMVTDTMQLKKLAGQELRKAKQIADGQSLQEAGLFVEDNALPLPRNAALTQQGLLLYYNPYEIAPYAFGPTELLLPYAQLRQLLKPDYRP